MPDQATYDRGAALAQLVTRLDSRAIDLSTPLAAGLTTPIPLALMGDPHVEPDVEILDALQLDNWALGASEPTPLDALIASHLYAISRREGPLKQRYEELGLGQYVERVFAAAEMHLS